MLSNSELAYMREAIDDLLPDTCNILSVTETNNGMGGVVQTWGTATAGVICRVDVTNLRSGEQVTGGSLKPFQQTILSRIIQLLLHPTGLNMTARHTTCQR